MRLNITSLVVGFFSALSLIAFLGADHVNYPNARFELEATDNHVFVLDVHTGKVWQKFVTDGAGQTDQDFAQPKIR